MEKVVKTQFQNSGVENEKNCPSCRTRAKLYDVIRLFGIFEKEEGNNEKVIIYQRNYCNLKFILQILGKRR